MLRTRKKWLCALLTLVFIVSFAFPAMAYTNNRVDVVPTLQDDSDIKQNLGSLTLLEDKDYTEDLKSGRSFTVTFPSGVKLQSGTTVQYVYNYGFGGSWANLTMGTDWFQSGDYTLDITLPSDFDIDSRDGIRINPEVKIDGFDGGDIEVVVDGMGSGISSGTYVLGRVGEGDTSAVALSAPTIGEEGKGGIIRITENATNAIGKELQEITVKLPKGFKWDKSEVVVDFLAGFAGTRDVKVDGEKVYKVDAVDRTLTITFKPVESRTQRGVIQITPWIIATRDAKYGDVEVELSGDEVSDADLVIAKYADFGVSIKADGDVKEVLAGQIDAELTKLYFKENVVGSLLDGRKVLIEFPDWVKIKDVKATAQKNIDLTSAYVSAGIDDNEVEFAIKRAGSGKIEFKLEFTVSIEANASGDIVAEVSGRAGAEGEVVIGEALAPVEATAGSLAKVSIGKKGQAVADITITENKDGALMEKEDLIISLPDGIKFSGTPDVEVTAGNLDLDTKGIDADGSVLTIPIKSESSKPSTIEITGIEVDLDRTIPSGEVKVSIKGKALVENYEKDYKKTDDEYDFSFDTSTVVKVGVATVVAPGEETLAASFVIGDTNYVVDGVEYAMDAAPYVSAAGRTYVPVRYLAYALGVAGENIYWDQAAKTVTLLKGSTAVQLTIGSNVIKVNGIGLPMDVAPEVKDGRTMLPARFVAEVFGATVGYDADTQTVTIDM